MDVLIEIQEVHNYLHINITFSHVYVHHYDNYLLNYLPLMSRINSGCDMRARSSLWNNVINNSPIPPGLPHDTPVFRID